MNIVRSTGDLRTELYAYLPRLAIQLLVAILAASWMFGMASLPLPSHYSKFGLTRDWIPPLWLYILLAISGCMVLVAPIKPWIGCLGYTILLRTVSRYSAEFAWLHRTHAIECHLILIVAGWILWRLFENRKRRLVKSWQFWFACSFLLWIVCVETIARLSKSPVDTYVFHGPVRAATAILFLMVGFDCIRRPIDVVWFAMVVGVGLVIRGFLFPDKVHLDGDFAVLLVTVLPLIMLSSIYRPPILMFILSVVCGITFVYLLAVTENRGGAIGALLSMIAICLAVPRRFLGVAMSILVGTAGSILFLQPSYWKRFTDIWNNGESALSFTQRFEIWKINFELIQNHWVFGTGFGRSGMLVAQLDKSIGRLNAHNSWVAMLSECGLLGLLFYVLLFLISIHAAYKLLSHKTPARDIRWFGVAAFSSFMAYFGISLGHAREFYEFSYFLCGAVLSIQFDLSPIVEKLP